MLANFTTNYNFDFAAQHFFLHFLLLLWCSKQAEATDSRIWSRIHKSNTKQSCLRSWPFSVLFIILFLVLLRHSTIYLRVTTSFKYPLFLVFVITVVGFWEKKCFFLQNTYKVYGKTRPFTIREKLNWEFVLFCCVEEEVRCDLICCVALIFFLLCSLKRASERVR